MFVAGFGLDMVVAHEVHFEFSSRGMHGRRRVLRFSFSCFDVTVIVTAGEKSVGASGLLIKPHVDTKEETRFL